MARGTGGVPREDSTAYETVARWAASFHNTGLRPADDRARKLALLEQFCASVGVDPDTMVAKARADRDAKNGYLRALVAWAKSLPGSDRQRHDAENTIRGFFMKNGFRVMTKPYQDVYRRRRIEDPAETGGLPHRRSAP